MAGSAAVRRALPALPCPECRQNQREGIGRIGNRKTDCTTCNNFARAVASRAHRMLRENHQEEFDRMRKRAELDLYPQVIEQWTRKNPL